MYFPRGFAFICFELLPPQGNPDESSVPCRYRSLSPNLSLFLDLQSCGLDYKKPHTESLTSRLSFNCSGEGSSPTMCKGAGNKEGGADGNKAE